MSSSNNLLREHIVKKALESFDWLLLKEHFDQIGLSREQLAEICGYIRRHSDWICKYPRSDFERSRGKLVSHIHGYVKANLGEDAAAQITAEMTLIAQIEAGYRGILDQLSRSPIGQLRPTVRVSGCISRACETYSELVAHREKALAESNELNLMTGMRLLDEEGNSFSPEAVLDGLAECVAMTVIMEGYKNQWFDNEIVVLPELPSVGDEERFHSAEIQNLALFWRQWQRVEKRRRFLQGSFTFYNREQLSKNLPAPFETLVAYSPEEDGACDRDIYDHIANARLSDRLTQTYLEMEIETVFLAPPFAKGLSAELPPAQLLSMEEAHAGVSISELLGYFIGDDEERPAGLRLVEWVRGYIVLKELAKTNDPKSTDPGDRYTVLLQENELIACLQAYGLKHDLAAKFISLTCLHRSSRDMFDCPLIRVGATQYLLFIPAIMDINVAMVILSNLSNRNAELSRKGKAFERSVREVFEKQSMPVFAFKVHRNGEEFEYDAVVPWDNYLFVFECKNRSLSGNDPTQTYYFDLEVNSQVKQVRRLANALMMFPDIIANEIGEQFKNLEIVPCVLHSLPYSRLGELDGVYFTDWSALTRFFDQPHFRIKVPHRIGNVTVLHRTSIRRMWEGDKPTANDFLKQLANSLQLELSTKHLDLAPLCFPVGEHTLVMTTEIVRTEMSARSVSEAMGVDPDKVMEEIAKVSEQVSAARAELTRRMEDPSP